MRRFPLATFGLGLLFWGCTPSGDSANTADKTAESGSPSSPPVKSAKEAVTTANADANKATSSLSQKVRSDVVSSTPRPQTLVPQGKPGDATTKPGAKRSASGVEYSVLQEGSGVTPPADADVRIHITGWLRNGDTLASEFWNSRDDGVPHEYKLNDTDLIKGLVEAVTAMKRGERRWVVVPSSLAYGDTGFAGGVPPNTDLVVDVELVDFSTPLQN